MEPQDTIFLKGRDITDPAERAAYLAQACGNDGDLRQRVEAMLRDAAGAEAFFGPEPAGATVTDGPGTVIGRYKLLQKIGEGGMGVVYMAEQREPVIRKVALKIIKLGMDTRQVVARFEAERQALALMDHPNIAKVLDGGATESGRPYFVMDLVPGLPITQFCDEANLPTRERLELFLEVCSAVQHAHQKGIIHRDLKPSNILVTLHGDKPVPKVIDFGVAKVMAGRLTEKTLFTQFQQFIGTAAYMSPEQASLSGLDIDTRSDIYALGVLLYELLTGTTPFDGEELVKAGLDEMRRTIREKEPPRPSNRISTLPGQDLTSTARQRRTDPPKLVHLVRGELDWIVMKALEKDRARRYETANGLAADIKRHLNDEPIVARPPSTVYRFRKSVRRNKLAFAAAGAVAASLVAGLAVSTWLFIRESKAHDRAVAAEREQSRLREAAETAQANEAQQRKRAEAQLYVANMNLAPQAWEQHNVARLRELLDQTAAYPQRGFEWYYWQRQPHQELKTLRGHGQPVVSVAFSRDGHRIVTASYDHTATVWDAGSGKELLTLKGHGSVVNSAAFSPDGKRIATGSKDYTAKIWDAATGRELLTLNGHTNEVFCVAFSPDGQRIVTSSFDHTAKVWEAATGKELLSLEGHRDEVNSAVFSPDGKNILTTSDDWTTRMWNADSGKEMFKLDVLGNSVAFSPDGRAFAIGVTDGTARLCEASGGKELLSLKGHDGWLASVAFSPDGQRIVTGSQDQTARVWDVSSGKELRILKGHVAAVRSVAFSPDGGQIVTCSEDGTVKMWDAAGIEEPLTLMGHSDKILGVAFSPDGARIAACCKNGTAKVWDTASGKTLLTIKAHADIVSSVAFSPDGLRILTGSLDHTAKVWDAANGEQLFTLIDHTAPVIAVAFSPDGRRIVTGGYDKTARIWDAANGKALLTLKGHTGWITSVAFAPDGQRIATGGSLAGSAIKMWEAASGRELLTLEGQSDGITSLAFSPDGRRIVSGAGDQTARVWDAASGKSLLTIKGQANSVAFSADGLRIVTGGGDGAAKLWDAATGSELLTLKGHTGFIASVAFSPDGLRIVTGSWDHTAKVWEAATAPQVAAWQAEER
jgi:WD40 repeat protein/serine/threonine protein kinase